MKRLQCRITVPSTTRRQNTSCSSLRHRKDQSAQSACVYFVHTSGASVKFPIYEHRDIARLAMTMCCAADRWLPLLFHSVTTRRDYPSLRGEIKHLCFILGLYSDSSQILVLSVAFELALNMIGSGHYCHRLGGLKPSPLGDSFSIVSGWSRIVMAVIRCSASPCTWCGSRSIVSGP